MFPYVVSFLLRYSKKNYPKWLIWIRILELLETSSSFFISKLPSAPNVSGCFTSKLPACRMRNSSIWGSSASTSSLSVFVGFGVVFFNGGGLGLVNIWEAQGSKKKGMGKSIDGFNGWMSTTEIGRTCFVGILVIKIWFHVHQCRPQVSGVSVFKVLVFMMLCCLGSFVTVDGWNPAPVDR